ncbi:MAG: PEP/pyruvate-binding domain-containing protein, partial [Planctomycetes bacterium]|nr:PEP/pyruvate-binding domain-containing protein [Planctomycetota bacterium]
MEREDRPEKKAQADPEGSFFKAESLLNRIGDGEIGGKAQGLAQIRDTLGNHFRSKDFPEIEVGIPRLAVVATDLFDRFMTENRLYDLALSDARDRHIANAFQKAKLPDVLVDKLRALVAETHSPLAIRSSSLLEDSMKEPFAGVYATKMVPNNQFSAEARLRTLLEAIKFVYASTFFRGAKDYRRAAGRKPPRPVRLGPGHRGDGSARTRYSTGIVGRSSPG